MEIYVQKERGVFALSTPKMSYLMKVDEEGRLVHLYWGAPVKDITPAGIASRRDFPYSDHGGELYRPEYRAQDPRDFDPPALSIRYPDGVRNTVLRYRSYSISDGALTIVLSDDIMKISVELLYQGWGDLDLITRSVTIRNEGEAPVVLETVRSATLHLPGHLHYRLTHFAGKWGAEYQRQRIMLTQSQVVLESHRGVSASHQSVPFFALDPMGRTTETAGEVYFGALHWSGDFELIAYQNPDGLVGVTGGIGTYDTFVELEPQETFTAPGLTFGYTGHGFGEMSRILYDWQYDFLLPRSKAYSPRPVIYNSWYPFEFDLHEETLLKVIEQAADIGAELFVVDDGWMKGRDCDRRGLGDWYLDEERFPHGFRPLIEACHAHGMKFGLWVEPEMVNPDSNLYRAHPDWVLHDEGRKPWLSRNQLVLNLAREDVCQFAIDMLDRLLAEYELDYLKWDMNRYFGETGWPGASSKEIGELRIRFIQNLYRIWDHLNKVAPHILFENCAGGGGRADFGMVSYCDRINRSDNADPVDLMLIHEGFTTLFPPKTAGGAGNISPSPNGINGRTLPLQYRIDWGMTGSMSIGIDLLTADSEELIRLKEAVRRFCELRPLMNNSYVYRIASAYEGPCTVLEYVDREGKGAVVFAFGHGLHFRQYLPLFRLRGLEPHGRYEDEDGNIFEGETLMNWGVSISMAGDYASHVLVFRKVG